MMRCDEPLRPRPIEMVAGRGTMSSKTGLKSAFLGEKELRPETLRARIQLT